LTEAPTLATTMAAPWEEASWTERQRAREHVARLVLSVTKAWIHRSHLRKLRCVRCGRCSLLGAPGRYRFAGRCIAARPPHASHETPRRSRSARRALDRSCSRALRLRPRPRRVPGRHCGCDHQHPERPGGGLGINDDVKLERVGSGSLTVTLRTAATSVTLNTPRLLLGDQDVGDAPSRRSSGAPAQRGRRRRRNGRRGRHAGDGRARDPRGDGAQYAITRSWSSRRGDPACPQSGADGSSTVFVKFILGAGVPPAA